MSRSRALFAGGLTAVLLWSSAAAAKFNISLGSLSADGQEVRNLSCSLDSGGLFAGLAVVGTLAKQKRALDACAPEGAAFSVQFTFADGGAKQAKVLASSGKSKEACVSRALSRLRTELVGTCSAIILTGNPTAARKAADGLAPPESKDGKDGKDSKDDKDGKAAE